MKLFYTIIITTGLSLPIFSQGDENMKMNTIKFDSGCEVNNFITLDTSNNVKVKVKGYLDSPYRVSTEIGIIPIPPATSYYSKAELLPLFKPGKRNIKFLKNNFK